MSGRSQDEESYSDYTYSEDSRSPLESSGSYGSYPDEEEEEEEEGASARERYYVTKESQENLSEASRKESYAGLRDLSDLDKIQERDIVAADGSIRGVKNRVRAGLANFENREALQKVWQDV